MDAAARYEQIYRENAMMQGGIALEGGIAVGGIRHKPLKRTKAAVAARKAYRDAHPKPKLMMDEKHVKARRMAKKDQRVYNKGVKCYAAEKKPKKAKAAGPAGAAGETAWVKHVKKTAKANGITYGEAMKVASKTYKKKA